MYTATQTYDKKYASISPASKEADISAEQFTTLQEARRLTTKAVREIEEKEFCSPEDLKLLLYRTVDDIYMKA